MLHLGVTADKLIDNETTGEFLTLAGERYYLIRNVDRMEPFFMSVISSADHWLFASSTGGLTAGRVSPETALFPYVPVDKIHESGHHTGSTTILHIDTGQGRSTWEPFNREHSDRYRFSRNLYKTVSGDKLCFEEVNHDLQILFRYTWATSDEFGFSRKCELQNLGQQKVAVELVDGLQNILPAGTPNATQTIASNLVDAYKWTELDKTTGLAIYTLYSGISDRAEPCESLRANTVFCLGLDRQTRLISSQQLDSFRNGHSPEPETFTRGIRGAYFVSTSLELEPEAAQSWQIVANIEQSQVEVAALRDQLLAPANVSAVLTDSIADGSDSLARIMAETDALQLTAEEHVTAHHYANVLFNNLRGGVVDNQGIIDSQDFRKFVRQRNARTFEDNRDFLEALQPSLPFARLHAMANERKDTNLGRLCFEYLPIRFGRRHGDPSRPWNKFAIRLKDGDDNRLFSYEGNWRDIFQNWEALAFSFPDFTDNFIAKFVNASTVDGYNPYRISKDGIDWEIEDPDDPWSYIGYWGDHQIIYLLKLLELSRRFHPDQLASLLHTSVFSYANVPYRIKSFEDLRENPKSTVTFDHDLADDIEKRVVAIGADGKLVIDAAGAVYHANLLEKLLVPLLAKLGNFVPDGGIWLNTQRPEWNDANNALVGHGLSMVTLYHLRRYIRFLLELLSGTGAETRLSVEVAKWLEDSAAALSRGRKQIDGGVCSQESREELMRDLGTAASQYRQTVYREVPFSGKQDLPVDRISNLLEDALALVDQSIASNRREDGLYHAYNLLHLHKDHATVDTLYPMLEGQVAALSAGVIPPSEATELLSALFDSDIYREDQQSFMLYPDRDLPGFFDKNIVPATEVDAIPLLQQMLASDDCRILSRDIAGNYRFNADFTNVDVLVQHIDMLAADYGDSANANRDALVALYESVFNHRAFTGRSGGMFGFEGLGCIYWHMVSKLLLAIQECFHAAIADGTDKTASAQLGHYYYRVRDGLGFNKTPIEYGAFPTDPYSHTPGHAGAQQPGMTGQVKEEVLTRFGELGVRVNDGKVCFQPDLLRRSEFLEEQGEFRYLDIDDQWSDLTIPVDGLAFTWCQVPIVYKLDDNAAPSLTLVMKNNEVLQLDALELPRDKSHALFSRGGDIRRVLVTLQSQMLFVDSASA